MPNSENWLPFLIAPLVGVVAIASNVWISKRASNQLDAWAASSGLRIVDRELRWLRQGPFFWRSSRLQFVYHVKVEDVTGARRQGYVRVGGWWLGVLSSKVEARWER